MSFDAVRQQLVSTFQTEFTAAHPTVPIHFENQKFTQPKGEPYVYVALLPGISKRKEVNSSKRFYHYGVINISCMAPEDQGTKILHDLSKTFFTILADRDWNLGEDGKLTTYGFKRRNRGLINGFYTFNVVCEYRHEDRLVR